MIWARSRGTAYSANSEMLASAMAVAAIFSACCIVAVACPGPALVAPSDLDPGVGSGGKVVTQIGTGSDVATSVALQSDGKIVAAG